LDLNRQMREEWDRRAREDAYFYAAFARRRQSSEEFLASAAEVAAKLERELVRVPAEVPRQSRRALEIGCGPGRLMLAMSRYFSEIHGVDISREMLARARLNLQSLPHAHLHVTPGSGLPMFDDDVFDFVYSYIVFQHIPDRETVWSYLSESLRVLRAGGILCCQLRGTPPLATELERESATWTGCSFGGEEIAAFSRSHGFHLVAISGLDTQYLWTTWRKPDSPERLPDFSRFVLKAVTATTSGGITVPARGRGAAVSLWIAGLPAACHLGNLLVGFNGVEQRGCYLSPLDACGGCQLDARLPAGIGPGRVAVSLSHGGESLGQTQFIDVTLAPPRRPRILSITDSVNLASKHQVKTGVKVRIEDVGRPEAVACTVAGRRAEFVQIEYEDPITDTYQFSFYLPHKTPRGRQQLIIQIADRELAAEEIEIAG
jgi:SAM-dependent methyltransferase